MNIKLIIVFIFILFSRNAISQSVSDLELVAAAMELTKQEVPYDPSYFSLTYPMGDVPANIVVCTDVIIRAYRKVGIDLQQTAKSDYECGIFSQNH